jgi:hypothetical protein
MCCTLVISVHVLVDAGAGHPSIQIQRVPTLPRYNSLEGRLAADPLHHITKLVTETQRSTHLITDPVLSCSRKNSRHRHCYLAQVESHR